LSFYRESGKPSSFDVFGALQEVVELYGPKARSRNLKLELFAKDEGLNVEGFLGEFRQVASNLLLNAMDATPSGGIIKIRARVASGNGQRGVRVTFADSGAGIQRGLGIERIEGDLARGNARPHLPELGEQPTPFRRILPLGSTPKCRTSMARPR